MCGRINASKPTREIIVERTQYSSSRSPAIRLPAADPRPLLPHKGETSRKAPGLPAPLGGAMFGASLSRQCARRKAAQADAWTATILRDDAENGGLVVALIAATLHQRD